ncbi:MAG: MBL fold metallo-hydrolase [Candidatus Omnitrophota bacterium]|jgi:7,8-dihydropterin-6-yl-methyl-4-(beta-D-ribofuranosyl)aminobenzene 5'-phosphate synthase
MHIKIIATGSTKWERFIRRWGVAFLIGEDVLFDTFGDPDVFLDNMHRFNVDAAKIKHIILSHDDWDHISGLWYLIRDRKDITVYVCPGFKQEIKDRIVAFGARLIEVSGILQIKDSVYSTGELCKLSEGRKIYEQSVVIRTADGLAVICGCAHPGVVNIIREVKENFQTNVHLLIGGLHLKDNTNEKNRNIIEELRKLGIRKVAPLHCTGQSAQNLFKKSYKDKYVLLKEGEALEC